MIQRILKHVASLPLWLISGMAAAETVFVPCDFTLPKPPSAIEHAAPVIHHHVRHHHVHRYPVGKRGRLGLHVMLSRGMCPVWVDDIPSGMDSGGGAFGFAEGTAATDYGDDEAGASAPFGFANAGGSSLDAPEWLVDAPLVLEAPTYPPIAPGPSQSTPAIPEAPTWVLLGFGFAALAVAKFKRRRIAK